MNSRFRLSLARGAKKITRARGRYFIGDEQQDCLICLEPFDDRVRRKPVYCCDNKHIICEQCFRTIQSSSGRCPMCRRRLEKSSVPQSVFKLISNENQDNPTQEEIFNIEMDEFFENNVDAYQMPPQKCQQCPNQCQFINDFKKQVFLRSKNRPFTESSILLVNHLCSQLFEISLNIPWWSSFNVNEPILFTPESTDFLSNEAALRVKNIFTRGIASNFYRFWSFQHILFNLKFFTPANETFLYYENVSLAFFNFVNMKKIIDDIAYMNYFEWYHQNSYGPRRFKLNWPIMSVFDEICWVGENVRVEDMYYFFDDIKRKNKAQMLDLLRRNIRIISPTIDKNVLLDRFYDSMPSDTKRIDASNVSSYLREIPLNFKDNMSNFHVDKNRINMHDYYRLIHEVFEIVLDFMKKINNREIVY